MELSLILPVYNAEKFLPESLVEIDSALSQTSEAWELVLVVDAGPDASAKICREFASTPRPYAVKVLINERNLGKGATVKRGMLEASGRFCIFNDCDLAYPMTEVKKISTLLKEGHDMVIASRVKGDSFYILNHQNFGRFYLRHLVGRFFNHFVNGILPLACSDTQAGLKGFRAEAAKFLFSQIRLTGFSFDVELLHLAQRSSLSIVEMPVHFYHQPGSTISFFKDGLKMSLDLLRIRYWTIRSKYNFSPAVTTHAEVDNPCG